MDRTTALYLAFLYRNVLVVSGDDVRRRRLLSIYSAGKLDEAAVKDLYGVVVSWHAVRCAFCWCVDIRIGMGRERINQRAGKK